MNRPAPPPSHIADREREVVEEFALFEDWMGRYEHLIEQARHLPPLDPAFKTDEHRIHGCQSQVWIRSETHQGRMHFAGDSDAMITKGLVGLLVRVLEGQPPEAVATAELGFFREIGLDEHLSASRKNGLAGMIRQIRRYAAENHPAQS